MSQRIITVSVLVAVALASTASAAIIPFTEEFSADNANWTDVSGLSGLTWNAAGGPDGGSYVSGTVNFLAFPDGSNPVAAQGTQADGASGGAFFGDYIAEGVTGFAMWVRHDFSTPLQFFGRFATPTPGFAGIALQFGAALPNEWTPIFFPVGPTSPNFVTYEAGTFETVMNNITKLQIGVIVPTGMGGLDQDITIDVDKLTIIPEPASVAGMLAGAMMILGGLRRRG
ncbi:MAG: PEP-CTERM sorting domain-containing protein [Planctomycetota bacterium]|nr:MAG: PEP-CTERM sorting domain-containing protein [Planctomycetota bacterium]